MKTSLAMKLRKIFLTIRSISLILILLLTGSRVLSQSDEEDIILYSPPTERQVQDTVQSTEYQPAAAEVHEDPVLHDQYNVDSLDARLRFIEDSIQARMQFLQDSILARETFVRDSIARRERILDSLNVFVYHLPRLLDASMKAYSDEIIYRTTDIHIVGDSTLSNYEIFKLTFDFSSPFTPWKSVMNLSDKPPRFEYEAASGRIKSIKSPKLDCQFIYGRNDRVLIIRTKSSIQSTRTGMLYKEPIDSVFFNAAGKVIKLKKYVQFYEANKNYQKGRKLFLHLEHIKQYEYNTRGQMTKFELTKFCDRKAAMDPKKVCAVISYDIMPQGNTYIITRINQPANTFSDGVFVYEFKDENTLSGVSFENKKKTERWKTIIEVNEDGNVSRYLYDKDGVIRQTLLVHYFLDDPRARHKVETITCTFEDDGISYYQQNNTTGRSRSRDRMTMEWTDWQ